MAVTREPNTSIVPAPPTGAVPDLLAAWDAMCRPVRQRYAETERPNRSRAVALRLLRWEAARRNGTTAGGSEGPGPKARILVVQPDHLGGVLASTPAIRLVKEALSSVEITVLAGPWGVDVAEHCPAVDRARTCRFPAFDRATSPAGGLWRVWGKLSPYERLVSEATALRAERYDVAMVCMPDFWCAALVALAGIPHRIGLASPDGSAFLTEALPVQPVPVGAMGLQAPREHVAASQLRLASRVLSLLGREAPTQFDGRMAYEPSAADRAEAVRVWRAHDLDEAQAVVAVHPAPGAPAKRWPPERFAMMIDHLTGRFSARAVLTGGPSDVDEARAVERACRSAPVVLAGKTSFGALGALFERCRFALGTDNGAMHLATARGVATLRLFGPVDPGVWSGWTGEGGPVTVSLGSPRACAPCHRLDLPDWRAVSSTGAAYPCMDDLSVEQVIAAVEDLWRRTQS